MSYPTVYKHPTLGREALQYLGSDAYKCNMLQPGTLVCSTELRSLGFEPVKPKEKKIEKVGQIYGSADIRCKINELIDGVNALNKLHKDYL